MKFAIEERGISLRKRYNENRSVRREIMGDMAAMTFLKSR